MTTKHLITEMKVIFLLFHSGYVLKRKNNPVGRCIFRFCVNSAIERALSCPLCVAGPVSVEFSQAPIHVQTPMSCSSRGHRFDGGFICSNIIITNLRPVTWGKVFGGVWKKSLLTLRRAYLHQYLNVCI